MTIETALSADRPATRLATRLAFLVAGCAVACWAPLVPFAKERLGVNDKELGFLLLCIGVGSVLSMLVTGALTSRYGSKQIIVLSGFGLALILPLLTIASTPLTLGITLFVFGGCMGSLDVAMNVHALEVEHAASRPLMSGFHALFSIGGFAGSALMTFLLSASLTPLAGTIISAALIAITMAITTPRLLRAVQGSHGPLFVVPKGIVLLLALLASVTFLVEGALLDWSALLITGLDLVAKDQGGIGYVIFSIAMTTGRLTGDAITAKIGDKPTMFWGSLIAIAGFAMLLLVEIPVIALSGFLFIGLGAANIVPILFRRAGTQPAMPPALAIAAITTMGYAGILLGPAVIGFVAEALSLPKAFWILVGLFCIVPLSAHLATANTSRSN
jgi:predicted MFS family arabinose efflux permease